MVVSDFLTKPQAYAKCFRLESESFGFVSPNVYGICLHLIG